MKKGFNKRQLYTFIVTFTALAIFILWGTFFLLTNPIQYEDKPMDLTTKLIFAAAFLLIGFGMLIMVVRLLFYHFSGRGCLTLTESGIENTFLLFHIFTLYTVFSIKRIPWGAVVSLEQERPHFPITAKLNTDLLDKTCCSRLAKWLLKLNGFSFGFGFASVSMEEIEEYRHKRL